MKGLKFMVTKQTPTKTSSAVKTVRRGAYAFQSVIKADWQLPLEPELGSHMQQNLAGGLMGYVILAKRGGITADPARWKTPPHRVFVNLPVSSSPELGMEIVEPKALLGFCKRYGFLYDHTVNNRRVLKVETSASLESISSMIGGYGSTEFRELIDMKSQAVLKYAWKSGDRRALEEIAKFTATSLQAQVDITAGTVVIKVANAWTMICMLVLRDHAAGKTAVCANPECPAPYFLKSRKTQRICEAGECVAWAQRNYALKWWRENESKASKGKLKGGTE
jgi:hypothetical protein